MRRFRVLRRGEGFHCLLRAANSLLQRVEHAVGVCVGDPYTRCGLVLAPELRIVGAPQRDRGNRAPAPAPLARNEGTEAFFDASAEGKFLLLRCAPHGHISRPQSRICPECGSEELEPHFSTGRATLVSWAVVPSRREGGETVVPAIGELEEGPWWWSQVVDTDPGSLRAGMRLRVGFRRPEGSEAVPVFEVATE